MIWKDIKGYEGIYKVSEYGDIKSIHYNGGNHSKLLKPAIDKYGYSIVALFKNKKLKTFKVHRIVAKHFLEESYSEELQVNHINEIKTDNHYTNLEMCTNLYNCNYGSRKNALSKKVIQSTLNDEFVKEWESTREIERTLNINHSTISKCCRGILKDPKTHKPYPLHQFNGYKWKYKE